MSLSIAKRASKRQTPTAVIREWAVRTERQVSAYSIVEVINLYGLSKRYLAVRTCAGGGQFVVSRHRKRSGVIRSLERIVR